MATLITKNSSTASAVPLAGDLTKGELAVNVTDKKVYTKDNVGNVVKIVGSLGNQEANAVAITGGSMSGVTHGDLTVTGEVTEGVYTLSGTVLDPANGTIQVKTLSANTTFTESLTTGQAVTLMIDDGSAYTVTWPTITWKTDGGVAPTLNTTGYTVVVLWKVGTTLYGARVGNA